MPAMPASFKIAQVQVGRGLLGLCPLPGRNENYAADLATLVKFGPALVLSLVEIHEYQRHNAPTLIADLASLGIAHISFPTRDFGTPCLAIWPPVSGHLHGLLANAQRIVIHCLGGCGRTGTIALRLMIEAGEDPKAALIRLRTERPCAVETKAQLRWTTAI